MSEPSRPTLPDEATAISSQRGPVYIARSESCIGDGVIASRAYRPGELITELPRPLVGSLDTERLEDTCANCYTWTEGSSIGSRLYVPEGTKVFACAGCKRFRYCSKRCQKEAWGRGHKHECKNLRPVTDKEIPKAVLATMELLVRRKHALISEQAGAMLWKLGGHIDDFKKNGKYGGIELMALGTSQFSFTQDTFSKDFVAELYGRVLTNALTLITPTLDPLGIMVDPLLCHINHSCDPNVFIMMDGPKVSIRTLRSVKADEEIFVSYIDTTNPYSRRQSELKSRWFFDCRCSKCIKGPTLPEDNWAIEPRGLAKKVKDVADTLIKAEPFASDPANYVGESRDEKRVAAIQGQAFEDYEKEQQTADAEEAIRIIENNMRMCHESKLWPVYRQPFAALRDDLILNLLLVGQYQVAWAQCAKRYRYITPKLYPEPHHPVRVVQTWQMAMLALYLSSEGVAMGVDLGPIAYMLIMEVAKVSNQSHGENSAFSQSVKKKLDEETAEVRKALGDEADGIVQVGLPQQRKVLLDMGDWIQY